MTKVFNGAAFFIVLREVLEACLIVALILATLSKTGATHLRRAVWVGTASGALLAFILGVAFSAVYYARGDQIFSADAEKIFEGVAFLLAGALLAWVVVWTRSGAQGFGAGLKRRVEQVLDAGDEAALRSARVGRRGSVDLGNGAAGYLGDAEESDGEGEGEHGEEEEEEEEEQEEGVGVVDVCDEEGGRKPSPLFGKPTHPRRLRRRRGVGGGDALDEQQMQPRGASFGTGGLRSSGAASSGFGSAEGEKGWLGSETKTKLGIGLLAFSHVLREGIETVVFVFGASKAQDGSEWQSVLLPSFMALAIGLLSAVALFKGLATINIRTVLKVSGLILVVFAAGLTSHGFHELSEVGWFGTWGDDPTKRDWWNATLWSTADCCSDTDNEFFAMLRALFGYQDKPTFIEVTTHFAYILVISVLVLYADRLRVAKARNKTARLARSFAAAHLAVFFVLFVYTVANPTWTGVLIASVGLLLSLAATFVVFDVFALYFEAFKPARRALVLLCAVSVAVLCVVTAVLHIVQCACLEKDCALPPFFYWGVIFSKGWLLSARSENSFVPLAVLSVSFVLSVFSLGSFGLLLFLFALHVGKDGEYIYAKGRIKVGVVRTPFDDVSIDDAGSSTLSGGRLSSARGRTVAGEAVPNGRQMAENRRAVDAVDSYTAGLGAGAGAGHSHVTPFVPATRARVE